MTVADLSAERAVLAAMLLDKRAVPIAASMLGHGDFFHGAHRTIFEAAVACYAEAQAVDLVLVSDELERRGHLADVGGVGVLTDLLASAYAWSAVSGYAKVVAEKAERRRTAEAARTLAAAAEDPTADLSAALSAHVEALATGSVSGLRFLPADRLSELEPPEWLIDGHLPKGLTVLYGPSGARKSFIAVDWAASIQSGRAWFGNAVARAPVVYVAGEGASGMAARTEAWRQSRRSGIKHLFVMPDPIDMLDPRSVALLSAGIGDTGAGAVVLDTLARTWSGDENSTQDMGRYIGACDRLRADRGVSVVVVHHTGHEASRMRGNTALFAAADAVIRADVEESGDTLLSQPPPPGGKAKDAEHFRPWHLRPESVGESIVLDLSHSKAEPDTRGWLLAAMQDKPPLPYTDLLALAGGDATTVNHLISTGALAESGDGYYTLPSRSTAGRPI